MSRFLGLGGSGVGAGGPSSAQSIPVRKRDKFLQLLRSTSPTPPNSALRQAPSPSSSSLGLQQHVPSTTGSIDLWTKAYNKLPNDLKQQLGLNAAANKLQTLQDVLRTAIQAKEANMENRLKLKWGDNEIDVQGTADKLVGWITKFKEVGDIAVQYNPVHAALPWAGVRFVLMVRTTIYFLYSNIY